MITLYNGDCSTELSKLSDNSVDLIVTSPPYALQRNKTYGGVKEEDYVDWFLNISKELKRVLKSTGTFILNVKENVVNGERSTYVIELILALRKQGWLWTEEWCWYKTNSVPGKWPNRFRDSWERILQFNKDKKFNMYQDEVKIPIGNWAKTRLKNLGKNDTKRYEMTTGSGFGRKMENWIGKDSVYPSNVLRFPTVCNNTGHSAPFPKKLPEFFIKLFSKKEDLILDPFVGSGTTVFVAQYLGRNSIGIDLDVECIDKIKKEINVNIFEENYV